MESGYFTLFRIVGTLVACISAIPLMFLLLPGSDTSEPSDRLDGG